jgi:hypothetical protein
METYEKHYIAKFLNNCTKNKSIKTIVHFQITVTITKKTGKTKSEANI